MSELKKCTTCSFSSAEYEWGLSLSGKRFNTCVKCRGYHRNHRKCDDEVRL